MSPIDSLIWMLGHQVVELSVEAYRYGPIGGQVTNICHWGGVALRINRHSLLSLFPAALSATPTP